MPGAIAVDSARIAGSVQASGRGGAAAHVPDPSCMADLVVPFSAVALGFGFLPDAAGFLA